MLSLPIVLVRKTKVFRRQVIAKIPCLLSIQLMWLCLDMGKFS